jgi:hypothetical protein
MTILWFARREYVAGSRGIARLTAIRTAWRDPSIAGIVASVDAMVRSGVAALDPAEAREAGKPFVATAI